MTTHEKTRLIELLTSGDEQNILLAKEICEQQGRVDVIQELEFNKEWNILEWDAHHSFYTTVFDFDPAEAGFGKMYEKARLEKINQYYAQHLQSSE